MKIPYKGTVLCGVVECDIKSGDRIRLLEPNGVVTDTTIWTIETFNKTYSEAIKGTEVCIFISGYNRELDHKPLKGTKVFKLPPFLRLPCKLCGGRGIKIEQQYFLWFRWKKEVRCKQCYGTGISLEKPKEDD